MQNQDRQNQDRQNQDMRDQEISKPDRAADQQRLAQGEVWDQQLLSTIPRQAAPFTVLASPSWRGVDAEIFVLTLPQSNFILKQYSSEHRVYINLATSFQAAHIAGGLNIAPEVVYHDLGQQCVVMRELGVGWRCAGLQDLVHPIRRQNIIAAKKVFQQHATALISQASQQIFQQIFDLAAQVRVDPRLCPAQLSQWLLWSQDMQQRIEAEGVDQVPCHRDGNISNVMIGPQDAIQLLDYDMAAWADPLEDLGCFIMEAYESKHTAQAGFEEWQGYFNALQFERAWCYGILDDLRWGLIALTLASISTRQHLEFAKYAAWRLLRFKTHRQQLSI